MNPQSEHILIVDDEKRMCESLSTLLSDIGYKVQTYQDSSEAADFVKSNKVDLVITDIKMPNLTGLDLLKIIKKVDDEIPVILMTGYASLDSAVDAINAGAYDYLMKPVEFAQLNLAVRRALEKRKSDLARLSLLEELKISNLILNRRIGELNALYEAGKSIGSTANLKELLKQIVALACNVCEAQVGSIMLLDERAEYMTIEAAIGLEKEIIDSTKLAVGQSIAGTVAKEGTPLIINNVENHPNFKRTNQNKYGGTSLLCAPLKIKNKVIGVINLANKTEEQLFTENDLRLLSTFASQAAVAVDDANQFEKKRRRLIEFEILHEISRELPEIKNMTLFRDTLIDKLKRVFPIDYSLWLSFDKENQIFITDGASGCAEIPLTSSGKIDLKKIKWDDIVIDLKLKDDYDYSDIEKLTNKFKKVFSKRKHFPKTGNSALAIPIFRFNELAYIAFFGSDSENYYNEDDISLAKLVISQSAILFEKERTLLNATRLLTMGNMISEISHDLRRPLTTIKGGLQVIRGKIKDNLHNPALFDTVEEEVHHMNELIRELVDFSNPNKYETEKIDLKQLIDKAYHLIRPELDKHKITFKTEFDDLNYQIIINKNQILEMFLNLIHNAAEAMSEKGGVIKVAGVIEKPDHKNVDYLAIKVIDQGSGIKNENKSKVFDRYFTTKDTGTGLGLAVVERTISAHGGTLAFDSVEGEGTTFTVYFPINSTN